MEAPLILLLETATDVCSVGLCRGEALLSLRESDSGQDHAAFITLFIREVMEEAGYALSDLDAVALSDGPGSYTSLRIGASTAKGICFALNKPLLAIDTLRSLASACRINAPGMAWYCPMIDARRMEVYCALFDTGMQREWDTRAVVVEPQVFEPYLAGGLAICGSGAAKAVELLGMEAATHVPLRCSAPFLVPQALEDFRIGKFCNMAYYTPTYLKPPNITVPTAKKII
jgi:tRNA threonylcarbamoyladenosine biosynthesis protein TsaB